MPKPFFRFFFLFLLNSTFIVGVNFGIFAQQAPQISQFFQNSVYLNPALSGAENQRFVQLHFRNQWTGYTTSSGTTGSLGTQILSFSSPLNVKNLGISGYLLNDKTPSSAGQIYGFLQTAYHQPLGDGKLSYGIKLGIVRKTLDGKDYIYRDPNDPSIDPILNQIVSSSAIVPGLGLAYGNESYLVGLTYDYLTNVFVSNNPKIEQKSMLQLHGNYLLYLNDAVSLNPFLLMRLYNGKFLPEGGLKLELNQKVWAAGSFRPNDAAILMLGINLNDNRINLGYSLDYTLVNTTVKNLLSHEVFLRFNLPKMEKKIKWLPVKTPRFSNN